MPRSIAQSASTVRRPLFVALSFLLAFGASSYCFNQKAAAMSHDRNSELGEINTESVSGNLHCEILTRNVSENLELTGVVWATVPTTGRYSFVVTKHGSGGSSNVVQSGLFQVTPTDKRVVGTIMVNALRGDRYHARLSAQSDKDEVMCDAQMQ